MSKTRTFLSLVLTIGLVATGCSKKDKAGDSSSSTSGTSRSVAAALPTADLKDALKAVPSDVIALASMAFPVSLADMSDGFGMLPIDPELGKQMQEALLEHSKKHIGIDASRVRSVVIFAIGAPPSGGAAIFSPVEGTMKGQAIIDEGVSLINVLDAEVFAAQVDKTVIVGDKDSVKAAVATLKGQRDSLTKVESAFGKFAAKQVVDSYFSVAADISKAPLPELPMTEGLSHAGIQFAGSGIKFALHGKNETLLMLSTQAKGALLMASNMAKQNMEQSSEEFAEGAAGIVGYYMAKNFTAMLEPKIEGDVMSLDFPFEGGSSTLMVFTAVTGVLAAVAIPAFMKYIKKSKTAEASVFLRKLADGARMLAMEGQPMPASVGPTPPLGTCCEQDSKCEPNAAQWEHPSWQALQFAIMDPHYYSFEYVNQGGAYEVRAYGDLDCDGMYSTFVMGSDPGGEPYILKEDELE